ncbi:MAG TPA: amidohydrolase family protein, partial [Caulobacter sp.]|nr:amidohydrolase family protein [Caulobacter sp.]
GSGGAVAALSRAEQAGAASPRIVHVMLLTGPGSDFWLKGEQAAYIAAGAAPGTGPGYRHVTSVAEVRAAVAAAKAEGASGIKLHSGFTPDLVRAAAEAARGEGLKVWSHGYLDGVRPSEIVEAGGAVLSHADMLAYEGVDDLAALAGRPHVERTRSAMAATPPDGPRLASLFERMRTRGVFLEPTILVMGGPDGGPYIDWVAAATRQAHLRGVRLCVGADALGGSSPNIHAELQLLVDRVGLTPLEAITAATRHGALALGLTDLGTLEPGKRADLVILTADPARDIRNTQTVWGVIKGGELYERARPMPIPPGAKPPPTAGP